jgi:peptide/nickel transport system substrate-binding protein
VVVPFMMPKRVAETDPFQQLNVTIGSGPFILKQDEWKPGEKVVFVKNPNYKPRNEPASGLAGGKVVNVDRVEWIWIPDAQTQVNALLSGDIDAIESLSHDLIPLVDKNPAVRLITGTVSNQYVFRMNWLTPPFNNAKIRQAAFVALREQDFLEAVIGDKKYWRLCKALFTCNSPLATEEGMADVFNGDAERAKAMLKEAGYDNTPVLILQPSDLGVLTNLAPVAKSQLERAGFKVEMQSMDWQSMVNRLITKKGPASEGGWNVRDLVGSGRPARSADDAVPCRELREGARRLAVRCVHGESARRLCARDQSLLRSGRSTNGRRPVLMHIPLGERYSVRSA